MIVKVHNYVRIMAKLALYAFVICQSLLMSFASDVDAQQKYLREIEIELPSYENADLKVLINDIQDRSDFEFASPRRLISKKSINLEEKRWNMEHLLREISTQAKVSIRRVNETISFSEVEMQALPDVVEVNIVQVSISGTITDENGEGLPGATIQEKGTTNGTITDVEGKFSLDVSENATLIVSFVGYQAREVALNGRSVLDLSLEADVSALEEVVVVGYGTSKKSDLTGSVASLNADEFDGQSINSFEEGLQGKLSGVHVNQATGQPGGQTIIRIRGQNSILGKSDPLYVLDGIPILSSSDGNTSLLANINPADIESIDVLKDASATAIYGARGSNGVILITTKQGQSGTQRVNFESSIGFASPSRKLDLLNSSEFVELANEQAFNDGQALPFPDVSSVLSSGVNTDWQDEIFKTAMTQNYSLSFSGGGKNAQYFTSASFMDQDGIIIGSGFTRGSVKLNLNNEISDKLKVKTNITVSRSIADRSQTDGTSSGVLRDALGAPPFLSPYDNEGNFTPGETLYGFPFSESAGDNPLITANERMNKLTINRFVGNIRTQYSLFKEFSTELMVGTDYSGRILDRYDTRLVRSVSDGTGSERRTDETYFIVENLYKFSKSFNDNFHDINAVAGITRESSISRNIEASSSGFVTDDFSNLNLGAGERPDAPQNGITEWDLLSILARVNYTLMDKYLITLSGRRDGSSRFGEGNKWAFFPSVALAWRIGDERFISQTNQISDLKLRFSMGKSGNQAIAPYQSLQRFTEQPLIIGGSRVIGFSPDNLGNSNLKWETTDQANLGLDFGMWNQRFRLNLDLYHKTTRDLLALVVLPPTSGFSTVIQNVGVMENKGIEVNVGYDVIDRQKLDWSINLNLTSNKNEVEQLSSGADVIVSAGYTGETILRVGEPVSSFYGLIEDGLTDNGLINYVDQNNDDQINNDDRVIIGNPNPDFVFGFTSRLDYNNFYLSAFLQGEFGKEILNENTYWHGLPFFRGNNVVSSANNRWSQENQDQNANYPLASVNLNFMKSDRFIEDGSYVRLSNVRLGYNLPTDSDFIRSLGVFVSIDNLLTITNYSWYNPDVNSFQSGDLKVGWDMNTYPLARTITIGLNIGL